jgi:hypothetical protein
MSRAYQDKVTSKWKWGTRGEAIYDSKDQCEKAGMSILIDKLRRIRDRLNGTIANNGR